MGHLGIEIMNQTKKLGNNENVCKKQAFGGLLRMGVAIWKCMGIIFSLHGAVPERYCADSWAVHQERSRQSRPSSKSTTELACAAWVEISSA